ncbi:MAG: clostripain-related cysteine peptidase [Candidatus Cryptobacteroides sp.]
MEQNNHIHPTPLKALATALILALAPLLMHSCLSYDPEYSIPPYDRPSENTGTRQPSEERRHTFIMFSLGHNNLSSALSRDLNELKAGFVPRNGRNDNVLLIFSHLSGSQTGPVLERVYMANNGTIVCDTLVRYSSGTISASAETIREVLEYAHDEFPSASYGMLLSSHATGYLPAGFYANPDGYRYAGASQSASMSRRMAPYSAVPYIEPQLTEGEPMVKSIGQDVSNGLSYEIEISSFADAIPMKLSYILFDACLMGGIEVAYELRGKCDMVGFSQTEVLSNGFLYSSVGEHLLGDTTPHPELVCEDYFNSYDVNTGVYRSATISLIDCDKLDPLAEICATLFDKYRDRFTSIDPRKVQQYYRMSYHWFYDLESIVTNLGVTNDELSAFRDAVELCTVYKAATPSFMTGASGFDINVFSGLSMYLPSNGNTELSKYYRTLSWNKAANLIQ